MALVVLLLPALLVSMDISILFVAGPAIVADLAPSASQLLWMMDVYSFVLAGLLIAMGGLGDRIGRRRLLLIGAAAFGAASLLLALAPSPELFIAGRALLGVGAATLAPSTLALIRAMIADEARRRAAVAAWTVAFTGGAVAGPVLGGLLLERFAWNSVFLINLPVMAVLLVAAPLLVPESRDPDAAGFDAAGAGLSLVGVLGLVFAAKRFGEHGPDPATVAAAVLGGVLLVAFVRRQRRIPHPLIDVTLFGRAEFAAAAAVGTLASLVMVGTGLLAFTFLQTVHGLSPLAAALAALPTFAGAAAGATAATALARRVDAGVLVPTGLLVGAAGMTWLALLDAGTPPAAFVAGYTLLTFGIGGVSSLANSLVLGAAPATRAGAAAGISETGVALGDALGIAAFGTISAVVYRDQLARAGLPDVPVAAADASPAVFDAFTTGLNVVAVTGAALLGLTALGSGLALRRRTPPAPRPPAPAPPPTR